MTYQANIPNPNDFISDSQPSIRTNFGQLNTQFSVDHVALTAGSDNGKHNQVTTPVSASHPATVAQEPIFYAMEDDPTVGTLHFSRGESNAVPTPLTSIHSSTAPIAIGANTNVAMLDFSGLTRAFGECWGANLDGAVPAWGWSPFFFDGTVFINGPGAFGLVDPQLNSGIQFLASGTVLNIRNYTLNAYASVYWTIKFSRLE